MKKTNQKNRFSRASLLICTTLLLSSCSGTENELNAATWHARETERTGGIFKIGKEYTVLGQTYRPHVDPDYSGVGVASWYGPGFHRERTANGEVYDQEAYTAAHRTLPMPSLVKVTNLKNNRQIVVRVNDRGPFARNRIIDLSKGAARALGVIGSGTAKVKVELLQDETLSMISALQGRKVTWSELANMQPEAKPSLRKAYAEYAEKKKSGDFFIHSGSFSNMENAKALVSDMRQLAQAEITPVEVRNRNFFRVRIGPFGSRDEAEFRAYQLSRSGFPATVVDEK